MSKSRVFLLLLGAVLLTTTPALSGGCSSPRRSRGYDSRDRSHPDRSRRVHRSLPPKQEIHLDEVISLAERGVPPEEILRTLKNRQPIRDLTLQDVLVLREARVPDEVIDAIIRPEEPKGR